MIINLDIDTRRGYLEIIEYPYRVYWQKGESHGKCITKKTGFSD